MTEKRKPGQVTKPGGPVGGPSGKTPVKKQLWSEMASWELLDRAQDRFMEDVQHAGVLVAAAHVRVLQELANEEDERRRMK